MATYRRKNSRKSFIVKKGSRSSKQVKTTRYNAYTANGGPHNRYGQEVTLNFDKLEDLMKTGPQIFSALDEAKANFEDLYMTLITEFERIRGQMIDEKQLEDPDLIRKQLQLLRMDEGSILGDLEKVINGEFSGLDDNLITRLQSNSQVSPELNGLLTDYVNAYTTYYNAFCKATEFGEKVGTQLRGEKQLYQFGLLTEKGLTDIYMDSKTQGAFIQDRNIFRLRVESAKDAAGRYIIDSGQSTILRTSLSTRYGLKEDDILKGIERLQQQPDQIGFLRARTALQGSETYNLAKRLYDDPNLLAGRWSEAMLSGFIHGDTENIKTDSKEFRDNLMWFWGGDQNFSYQQQRFSVSQKNLSFLNKSDSQYGFRVGSLHSLEYIRDLMFTQSSQQNEVWSGYWGEDAASNFLNRLSYNYQVGDNMVIPDEVIDPFYQEVIQEFYGYGEITEVS